MGVSRVVSAALCMLCVCLVSASAARALITSQQVRTTKPGVFKKLNGGPDEFKNHALPSAVSIVTDSNSVMYPFDLRALASVTEKTKFTLEMDVDSVDGVLCSIVGTSDVNRFRLEAKTPNGDILTPDLIEVSTMGMGDELTPTASYFFTSNIEGNLGTWTIVVHESEAAERKGPWTQVSMGSSRGVLRAMVAGEYDETASPAAKANPTEQTTTASFFMANNIGSPTVLKSHMTSLELVEGREIGFRTTLIEPRFDYTTTGNMTVHEKAYGVPQYRVKAGDDTVAFLDVLEPDGFVFSIPMRDDGASNDLLANDGVFGAVFDAREVGSYSAQVFFYDEASGDIDDRTSLSSFRVVEDSIKITGKADAGVASSHVGIADKPTHIDLAIEVDYIPTAHKAATDKAGEFRVYTEVYGSNALGKSVPVAWTGGIIDVDTSSGSAVVRVEVDVEWFKLANVDLDKNPIVVLKNTRLQSTEEGSVPVSVFSEDITVDTSAAVDAFDWAQPSSLEGLYGAAREGVVKRMHRGHMPVWLRRATPSTANAQRRVAGDEDIFVVLVHGYCSNANPFPVSDFTHSSQFKDYEQSRSNDEFAQYLSQYIDALVASVPDDEEAAVALVGHSQGGLVSTHLHAFYWSYVDHLANGRCVQSLCSPYKGSSGAGMLGFLTKISGQGCGANEDLTVEGAELWQAGVPADIAAETWYYYTGYPESAEKGMRYCSLATQSTLENPNDGATERINTALDGGNDMGYSEKECHTANMKYPPAFLNAQRNAEINAAIYA